ncbi:MAG: hypothetical protein ACREXT_01470, partial [Gammaproteobacteria bacterium]
IYPVMVPFARAGIERLHRDNPVAIAQSSSAAPTKSYRAPPSPVTAKFDFQRVPRDPLGRHRLSEPQLARLFALHAPVWTVVTVSDNDRIGRAKWENGRVVIDPAAPAMYQYSSFTRFAGAVLLQLNYVVWFPARPIHGNFDLLAGHIDGLTWRVTLDQDGTPLLYDVMHNCGCYHQFYPTARVVQHQSGDTMDEPLWVPLTLAPDPLAITLAAGTHYVTAITPATEPGITLTVVDYNSLRSLPYDGSRRRGIFGNDGIIPGTERAEQFVLWPLGVPAPGAMRARGHHATAFIGHRHFDDPDLLDRYFGRRN